MDAWTAVIEDSLSPSRSARSAERDVSTHEELKRSRPWRLRFERDTSLELATFGLGSRRSTN